jgi:hypothetical protein
MTLHSDKSSFLTTNPPCHCSATSAQCLIFMMQRSHSLCEAMAELWKWFSKNAITNIMLLKEVTQVYHVTYNSNDAAFIVWREEIGLLNMTF